MISMAVFFSFLFFNQNLHILLSITMIFFLICVFWGHFCSSYIILKNTNYSFWFIWKFVTIHSGITFKFILESQAFYCVRARSNKAKIASQTFPGNFKFYGILVLIMNSWTFGKKNKAKKKCWIISIHILVMQWNSSCLLVENGVDSILFAFWVLEW